MKHTLPNALPRALAQDALSLKDRSEQLSCALLSLHILILSFFSFQRTWIEHSLHLVFIASKLLAFNRVNSILVTGASLHHGHARRLCSLELIQLLTDVLL